jgi:two-component system, OmpR family, alkaline phosphatase synthesis response regulator PhoP
LSNPAEAKKQILLAEDEEHIAKLVSFKLSKEGYEVTIAPNGKDAIEKLLLKPWSLLILDVMMPFADGWQVLRQARATPATAHLPVLMLTAKSYQHDVVNAAELGATQFIKKPFEPAVLAMTVRKLIDDGKA